MYVWTVIFMMAENTTIFGIHGCGITTAADSLTAIKKYIYDEKSLSKQVLIEAVDNNFENDNELLMKLRFETPKMGNNIEEADNEGIFLLNSFARALKGKENCRGGGFRPGTGTAMYYLWYAEEIGASPDGRRKGRTVWNVDFSPSLLQKSMGLFRL